MNGAKWYGLVINDKKTNYMAVEEGHSSTAGMKIQIHEKLQSSEKVKDQQDRKTCGNRKEK